jgi:hypothetical protein
MYRQLIAAQKQVEDLWNLHNEFLEADNAGKEAV